MFRERVKIGQKKRDIMTFNMIHTSTGIQKKPNKASGGEWAFL